MPKRKKASDELQAEYRLKQTKAQGVASVVNNSIKWGALVFIFGFLYLSVDSLAGQQTTADIGINLLADLKLSDAFAIIFGSGGVAYGWRQRALRKKTIERLQKRIRDLETAHDPQRTSSGLTPRGDTHPADKE